MHAYLRSLYILTGGNGLKVSQTPVVVKGKRQVWCLAILSVAFPVRPQGGSLSRGVPATCARPPKRLIGGLIADAYLLTVFRLMPSMAAIARSERPRCFASCTASQRVCCSRVGRRGTVDRDGVRARFRSPCPVSMVSSQGGIGSIPGAASIPPGRKQPGLGGASCASMTLP